MKTLIVKIGYGNYAMTEEDAIRLLGLAGRMRAVKHTSNYRNYQFDDEAEPFCTGAELVEVIEPDKLVDPIEQATKNTATQPF